MQNEIFLIILIVLEIIEANIQKGNSLSELIIYNYSIYKYNLIVFILYNFTFLYAIFILFSIDMSNFWLNVIVFLKFLDISFKLYIFQKIDKSGEVALSEFIPMDVKITPLLRYSNTMIYSSLMFFALV